VANVWDTIFFYISNIHFVSNQDTTGIEEPELDWMNEKDNFL